jgi:hypothetical protein
LKSVALWSTNIRKLAKDHKGYGSAAINDMVCKIDVLNTLSYKLKSLREKKNASTGATSGAGTVYSFGAPDFVGFVLLDP